jgi:hypothetical protein
MFGSGTDAAYRRSQRVTVVPVRPGAAARGLASRLLSAGEDHVERRRIAQLLVDELSAGAGVRPVEVVVADRPQVHQHDGRRLRSRTYGYYRCWFENGEVSRARIRIYHRTAVRGQVVAPKVFLNTLLHEWVHHHDFAALRLGRSPHTAGFYARLRALADALSVGMVMPPEPDDRRAPAAPRALTAAARSASAGGRRSR